VRRATSPARGRRKGAAVTDSTEALINRRLEAVGCAAPPEGVTAAAAYYELLFRWNLRLSLTSLQPGELAVDRLIVEPFVAARRLPQGGTLLDVGSGGGSPAIPLKLCRPAMSLVMVESRSRKGSFLREAVRSLGLADSRVEVARVEDLAARHVDAPLASVVTVRAVRLDGALAGAISVLAAVSARLWLFHGPGFAAEVEGWEPEGGQVLVAERGSALTVMRKRRECST
jgi:16S rRNA (guanine527-N7)-methyltransferase